MVVAVAMTACAPGTPDEDSWRGDATRAVGDVASAVQTVRLSLSLARHDRIPHAYLQTVLVDAETNAGKSAQKLSAVQPPDVERQRASDVNDALEQATGLLTDARIAVVADQPDQYAQLERQLTKINHDLTGIEGGLEHPPEGAS
jgi:hypothetical protein